MFQEAARKDVPPADTIERVHQVLDSAGFPRSRARTWWWTAGDDCHSCQLRFANYPLLFANGKGATRELAYASAAAEFVERLQCRLDDLFARAGNICTLPPFVARTPRDRGQLAHDAPWTARAAAGVPWPQGADQLPCLPFVDVLAQRIVDLPFDGLLSLTGSTGMCAGNSPEEAIVQGLCEVFERHAIDAVRTGRVRGLPTLRLEALPIRSAVVRRQLRALLAGGVDVRVKDATLGGRFPVLALVLVDPRARTCRVSFGSDPEFDIALSRCITEAFQGAAGLHRPMPTDGRDERSPDVYNRPEGLIERLMDDTGPASVEGSFRAVGDSREALAFAVSAVRRIGVALHVRDCSMLGFPSYYVHVEELSPRRGFSQPGGSALERDSEGVRATLFALDRASAEAVRQCADLLFDEVTRHNPLVEQMFHATVLFAPVAACVDLRTLLVLMLLEAGRVEEARALAARPSVALTRDEESNVVERVASRLAPYHRARGGLVDPRVLEGRFEEAFGRSWGARPSGRDESSAPRDAAGERLLLPRCTSVYACPSCPCRPWCRLDEWYRLARHLRARAAGVDQAALRARLASLGARRDGM